MDNSERDKVIQVVNRLKSGDQHAFEELYTLTHNRVYFLALKLVRSHDAALEVVQETYISVYKSIGKLYKSEVFNAWLSKIVINKCRDYLSKPKEVLTTENEEFDDRDVNEAIEDTTADFIPHEVLDRSETRNMIMALIDTLPDAQRTTVMLYYYQSLSVEEIAAIMECPAATVKSRLQYARRQIKTGVEGYEAAGVKLYNIAVAPMVIYLLQEASKGSVLVQATSASLFSTISQGVHAAAVGAHTVAAGTYNAAGAHTAAYGAYKLNLFAKLAASSIKAKIIAGIVTAVVVTTAVVTPIILSATHDNIKTAAAVASATAPEVVPLYSYKDVRVNDDGSDYGVNICMPHIASEKPGAVAVNGVLENKLKNIKESDEIDDCFEYEMLGTLGYKVFDYDHVLTIAVQYDWLNGALENENCSLYHYDYAQDKALSGDDMYRRLGLDEKKLSSKLSAYLLKSGKWDADLLEECWMEDVFRDSQGNIVCVYNFGEDDYQQAYIYDKDRDTFAETDILEYGFIFASDSQPTASAIPTEQAGNAVSEWENAYAPVLNKYREFVARYAENFHEDSELYNYSDYDFSDWGDPWDMVEPGAVDDPNKFGYAFRDIDNNGTPELFIMTNAPNPSIFAMYSYVDNTPILLGTYWSRNDCFLDQSSNIYVNWAMDAGDWGADVYRMSEDGRRLELVERVAIESYDENYNELDESRYYRCVGSLDNKTIISEEEANAAWSKYPDNNENSGLKFIPIM